LHIAVAFAAADFVADEWSAACLYQSSDRTDSLTARAPQLAFGFAAAKAKRFDGCF